MDAEACLRTIVATPIIAPTSGARTVRISLRGVRIASVSVRVGEDDSGRRRRRVIRLGRAEPWAASDASDDWPPDNDWPKKARGLVCALPLHLRALLLDQEDGEVDGCTFEIEDLYGWGVPACQVYACALRCALQCDSSHSDDVFKDRIMSELARSSSQEGISVHCIDQYAYVLDAVVAVLREDAPHMTYELT